MPSVDIRDILVCAEIRKNTTASFHKGDEFLLQNQSANPTGVYNFLKKKLDLWSKDAYHQILDTRILKKK